MPAAPTRIALALALAAAAAAAHADTSTLVGWARLPAATFSDGPTSGQFAAANPYGSNLPPYVAQQPVQGFSGVLRGPGHSIRVIADNGFGAQTNSADTLLRAYALVPDFKTARGGSGTVSAADWKTGRPLAAFTEASRITLHDPDNLLGNRIQADYTHYYNNPANPEVDPAIRAGRLLTGADFDIESVREDQFGRLWFGDEFGPYLIQADADGKVLRREVALPGVFAPQNPAVTSGAVTANLGSSGGFEGMAINKRGDRLYTLLEKTVTGDAAKTLRINEFDIRKGAYTGVNYRYRLEADGTAIGDMTAIDDERFIVIERNGCTATSACAPFKKLFLADVSGVANGGEVVKTELVNLMDVADPDDLNGDGQTRFSFPYTTIEDVLILDANSLLVINDNNFPYGGGRELASDDTEFLKIRLPRPIRNPATAK